MKKQQRVLFLCTGNSAPSQMAEGLVNHFLGDHWEAKSAGTEPAGYVHPLAIAAMAELGIDISSQRSKSMGEYLGMGSDFDVVVTLCQSASEACAIWPGAARLVHLGFDDPAGVAGGEAQRRIAFQNARDAIRRRVFELLAQIENAERE
jgi:arsenate reductase (thioredoxin)